MKVDLFPAFEPVFRRVPGEPVVGRLGKLFLLLSGVVELSFSVEYLLGARCHHGIGVFSFLQRSELLPLDLLLVLDLESAFLFVPLLGLDKGVDVGLRQLLGEALGVRRHLVLELQLCAHVRLTRNTSENSLFQ